MMTPEFSLLAFAWCVGALTGSILSWLIWRGVIRTARKRSSYFEKLSRQQAYEIAYLKRMVAEAESQSLPQRYDYFKD